jgi:hypothetical protein
VVISAIGLKAVNMRCARMIMHKKRVLKLRGDFSRSIDVRKRFCTTGAHVVQSVINYMVNWTYSHVNV